MDVPRLLHVGWADACWLEAVNHRRGDRRIAILGLIARHGAEDSLAQFVARRVVGNNITMLAKARDDRVGMSEKERIAFSQFLRLRLINLVYELEFTRITVVD